MYQQQIKGLRNIPRFGPVLKDNAKSDALMLMVTIQNIIRQQLFLLSSILILKNPSTLLVLLSVFVSDADVCQYYLHFSFLMTAGCSLCKYSYDVDVADRYSHHQKRVTRIELMKH